MGVTTKKENGKRKLANADGGKSKKAKKVEEEVPSSSEGEMSSDEEEKESEDALDASSSDEDELDNSDEEEGEVDEEKAQKTKESRAEQKRLREERKKGRQHGEKIQHIKKLWEQLRVKSGITAEARKKLVEGIWEQTHDIIGDLVFKHDSTRVIQTIFKYADKEKRIAITKALKGSYVELAKSSYGKYLLVKILHYGSKEVRDDVLNELHGNFRKLMRHKEGAYVIEDAYRDYSTAAQKRQIVREFYGSEFAVFKDQTDTRTLKDIIAENPDKRPFLMKNLKGTIESAVLKGSIGFTIIHAAMLEYVKNIDPTSSEREDFVDLITEQFAEMVHTNEGSQVASIVLSMATAKERKGLVRSLRSFASKCCEDEYGQYVMLALFNTVDDTVLVTKAFTPDFKENLSDLLTSKSGRRPFLYALVGRNPRYFTKPTIDRLSVVDEYKQGTSKKEDDVRRLELNKGFSPLILQLIVDQSSDLLRDNLGSQFIAEALLYAHDTDRSAAAEAVVMAFTGSPENEDHLIHEPVSQRTLRTLIQEGHYNGREKKVERTSEPELNFKSMLLPVVSEHLLEWATGDGSFVVVALLENLQDKEKKDLIKNLKSHSKDLKKAADSNKGSKLLLELL
jgi:pumilio family protein 6